MDCKDARLLLEFARPGDKELDHDEAEALRQHLADCPDCAVQAQAERHADEHIGRALRDVPVPAGLRERVLQKLGPERIPWYRRWPVRVAAAAALLLLGGLGYVWWFGDLPTVDLRAVYEVATAPPRSKEAAQEAFKAMNVTTVVPPQFNYRLLHSYDIASLPGHDQRVPHLLFISEDEKGRVVLADVYILSASQFDLDRTRKNFLSADGRVSLESHPENKPDYLYLVVSTGGKVGPFLANWRRG